MHYLEYNEQIQHRTGEYPLAFYPIDEHHPRYQMRMHWHRETELVRVVSGVLHLYVDNESMDVHPGDLVLLGEGVLHGGEPEECVYECVVFDPYALLMYVEPCKKAVKNMLHRTILVQDEMIRSEPEFAEALNRLYAYASEGVNGNEMKVTGAMYEVMGHLTGKIDGYLQLQSSRSGFRAEQLKPALEYIEKNYSGHITLEELARLTGLSPKYFCRCFRAITHRSPIDYLNYYRVECASYFLTTSDMTVAEIAQHCGYNDSSFFIKQFRRYKGTTPRQYRTGNQDEKLYHEQ